MTTTRARRCAACTAPCDLQSDATRRGLPETRCPAGLWKALTSGHTSADVVPVPVALRQAAASTAATHPEPPEVWGPPKWASLHTWALSIAATATAAELRAWLATFSATLPHCECRSHWRAILAELPPPITEAGERAPGALWAWTVAAHNAVNRRKGKPEMAEDAARPFWQAQLASVAGALAPAEPSR